MQQPERQDRWQNLVDIRANLDVVSAPPRLSRVDGKPRRASARATRFAEALAFSDGWSGISDARRRRDDLAA